jgi:hypothetical protein
MRRADEGGMRLMRTWMIALVMGGAVAAGCGQPCQAGGIEGDPCDKGCADNVNVTGCYCRDDGRWTCPGFGIDLGVPVDMRPRGD